VQLIRKPQVYVRVSPVASSTAVSDHRLCADDQSAETIFSP
jgi:hypothetical protein